MVKKYLVAAICLTMMCSIFGLRSSLAETKKDQNLEVSINEFINNLGSDDKVVKENARQNLKKRGKAILNDLRIAAKTKDRAKRVLIIGLYTDIFTDQQINPENDALILDAINDEYYMTRLVVLNTLSEKGHQKLALNLSKKLLEPSADDNIIFAEIINVLRQKADISYKFINPTMQEEGYLTMMGKKINSMVEQILSDENENVSVRKKLIRVYRQINGRDSNDFFLRLLSERRTEEFKKEVLSKLNTAINKNDMELVNKLRNLKSKESGGIKESYERTIIDLTDDSGVKK